MQLAAPALFADVPFMARLGTLVIVPLPSLPADSLSDPLESRKVRSRGLCTAKETWAPRWSSYIFWLNLFCLSLLSLVWWRLFQQHCPGQPWWQGKFFPNLDMLLLLDLSANTEQASATGSRVLRWTAQKWEEWREMIPLWSSQSSKLIEKWAPVKNAMTERFWELLGKLQTSYVSWFSE